MLKGLSVTAGALISLTLLAACMPVPESPTPSSSPSTTVLLPTPATPTPTGVPASVTIALPTATAGIVEPTPSGPSFVRLGAGQPLTVTFIQMLDETSGWAVGRSMADSNNRILRTADGGLTWRDVTPAAYLDTAFFMDANNAWAVFAWVTRLPGGLTGTASVWRTQDAGQTWTSSAPIDITTTGEYFLPSDLVFVDAQTGWLLAHVAGFMMQDFVMVFTTSDGGQTWERIVDVDPARETLPFRCDKTGLVFVDEKTGWITGNCNGIGSGAPYFQKTTDGGRTWQEVEWPPPASAADLFARQDVGQHVECGLYAPRFFSPQSGMTMMRCSISTSNGESHSESYLYTTDDGGQAWKSSPMPDHYDTMQFLSPTVGWVMTSKGPTPDGPHDIYLTKDGGQTLTQVKTVNWAGQLDFINEQEGWAIAKAGEAIALVHTTDGGKTWQEIKPQIAP